VQAGDYDHLMAHRREVYVDETGAQSQSVEIVDRDCSAPARCRRNGRGPHGALTV